MKPVFCETGKSDCVADAWLKRPQGRVPLKRIDDDPTRLAMFPRGPLTGEAAAVARELGERLEDVRVAAAILLGAAEKAEDTFNACPAVGFSSLSLDHVWARPARAAAPPLRRILDACDEFEDALAGAGDGSAIASGDDADGARLRRLACVLDPNIVASVAAVEAARAALPDMATRETIAAVSKTIAAVRPSAEALARVSPALAGVSPALAAMPPMPADQAFPDGPRALTQDELFELERVGLDLPHFSAIRLK